MEIWKKLNQNMGKLITSVYYIIDNGYDIHMTAINNFHLVILSLDNAVDVVLDPSM